MAERTEGVATAHGIGADRGFLPDRDPLDAFEVDRHGEAVGSYLRRIDDLLADLPDLLDAGELRPAVEALSPPPSGTVEALTDREVWRLCVASGFLASGYVNRIGADPVDRLPAGAAVPLYRTSRRLGRKPILSYDTLSLRNWRREDPDGDFDPENIAALQRFTRRDDEHWFVAIHVAIEAAAGPGLVACDRAQRAIREDDPAALLDHLRTLAESLSTQRTIMRRMTERNDPAVFATEYRPYYEGFDGVVFEGVDDLGGEPQQLRGGSGAQSSILPSIDETLGVEHETTTLIEKLTDMRSYMPESHRSAIAAYAAGPDVRPYVDQQDDRELTRAFNRAVDRLGDFREVHLGQVVQYIREVTGETTGTGGTDYMPFLGKLREETEAGKL